MWIRRKEHFRNASAGPERSRVSASVYFRPDTRGDAPPQGWEEACPLCGAHIIVSRPAQGGTAISEVLPSGACIPHPCFDRLRGKRAGGETLDLFGWTPR